MAKWKAFEVVATRGKDSTRYYINATSKRAAVEAVMQHLKDIDSYWRRSAFKAKEVTKFGPKIASDRTLA